MRAPSILGYFTRHATLANLLLVLLMVAGIAAVPQMRAQFFPDVVVDDIRVRITWDGAGAEDVDSAIIQLIEPTLRAVEGVSETETRAAEGSARVDMEFEPGTDMSQALDDVTTALAGINNLPDDAEDPVITKGRWRDSVTDVVITGEVGVDQLARFADEMVSRLFQEGVNRTTLYGVLAPQTVVEVSTADLVRYDTSLSEIANAIAGETDTSPAGNVASGAARVRAGVAKRSAEEIRAIVLKSDLAGATLTVGDVADVRVEGVDRSRKYYVGQNPAVRIRVDRSAKGDAIGIQHSVEEVAQEMMETLPESVSIDLIRTRAEAISARLDILIDNGITGLILVVVILFLFLNARTAFWVAAGIPVSMLAAVAFMYAFGLTINMISLFGLIITLGIVVDDAIVVGEHSDFRARHLGEDPAAAAENAARRMFAPVFSATITTVIAFFALTFIGGRFGEFIADVPFTVIAVLLASLIECFLILPNHMSHALAHTAKEHWYDWPSRQVNRGFGWVRDRLFKPTVSLVVTARFPVFAGALLLLASQGALFIRGDVPFRFFNGPERGSIEANFSLVNGATRADTLEVLGALQEATDKVAADFTAEYGRSPMTYVLAEIGGSAGRGLASAEDKDADLLGSLSIELIDADERPYTAFDVVAALQAAAPEHPLLEEFSMRGGRFGPGGDGLSVQLLGAEAEVLKEAAEELKTQLGSYPEISALEDTLAYDKEELVLELTPQGQALGFTIDQVGRELRQRLSGIEAATYPDGMRSASIQVELPEDELSLDFLDRSLMRTDEGAWVSLADIVRVTSRSGFSTVRRENGLRVVRVSGDIDEEDAQRAEEITLAMIDTILPDIATKYGVDYRLTGLAEQQEEFLSDALTGVILCLVGVYLVLAWIFASWSRPIIIMAVIPFGLIGAIWGHAAWGVPLSMFSIVGLVGMGGIIINDSIVLVTTVDEYARTRPLRQAIIDAATDRLRPVFLTTATTILGLMPLLFEGSVQAEFLKPTVITLVYGLGVGFFLVLIAVPALLAIQQDAQRQIASMKRMLGAGSRASRPGRVVQGTAWAMGVLFVGTLGWTFVTGSLPGGAGSIMAALGLFLGGSVVLVLAGFALALLWRQSISSQP